MGKLHIKPSTASKNRSRERWKVGIGCATVQIDWFAWTEFLIQRKLLTEREIDNKQAVERAMSEFLADCAARGFSGQ